MSMMQATITVSEIGKALIPGCYAEAITKQICGCMVSCHNSQCSIKYQCGFYERFINLTEERYRQDFRAALDGKL